MNNVIFARTRHHYKPYDDVYDIANLSGYTVCYLDEINWYVNFNTVIAPVKSPEWDAIPHNKRARLVWWNFERGIEDAPPMDMASPHIPWCVNEVWSSDLAFAKSIGAKYVFLGGHRAFGSVDVQHKQYDLISLMYYSGRRQALRSDLHRFTQADVPGGLWGEERHKRLTQSRLMLSAHQDDKPYSEPIRFMLAGCYALPLVSETCEDSGYWKSGQHYMSGPIDRLTTIAQYALEHAELLTHIAANAWRLVCVERPFRQEVEAAL